MNNIKKYRLLCCWLQKDLLAKLRQYQKDFETKVTKNRVSLIRWENHNVLPDEDTRIALQRIFSKELSERVKQSDLFDYS